MRTLLAVIALAALTVTFAQQETAAEPDRLLSMEPHRQLSVAEVDAEVGGRFMNNGEPAPQATSAVQTYLLSFITTAQDGSEITANAQLFVPAEASEEALLAFAPGSTGL